VKTIIISGARGYFGGVACREFKKRGWKVLRASRGPGDDLLFDLSHPEHFAAIRLEQKVDLFLHAAAAHEVECAREPIPSFVHNVAGALSALEFATANRIPRFAYVSTFHVFGSPLGSISEASAPRPANIYGMSHLQAEELVGMYRMRGDLKAFSVRPANFFGMPADLSLFSRWSLTPFAFPKAAFDEGKIVLKTPGYQRRNFVAVSHVCDVIAMNAQLDIPKPLVHVAGSETFSIRELADLVAKVFRTRFGVEVDVTVPEGENQEPLFEFCSSHAFPLPEPGMEVFIEELGQALRSDIRREGVCP
jgi:UDP-glucose 4-epimerase